MKRFIFFMGLCVGAASASSQVTNVVVDDNPGGVPRTGDVLEKIFGHYDSVTQPSIVVGLGQFTGSAQGGLFLYHSTGDISGPWVRTTIDATGDYYERGVAYTSKGDLYPGVIVSRNNETRWYFNPKNWGGDPYQPWDAYQVIASRPCHDIHLVDIDGDNNVDVVCSATANRATGSFVAFFNSWSNWSEVDDVVDAGDGIAYVTQDGVPHLITTVNGGTYIWINPRTYGGNARSDDWKSYRIAEGNENNAVEAGQLDGQPVVYESANEDIWNRGLVMFRPTSSDLTQPWNMTTIAADFRAVHQLNAAIYPDGPSAYDANGNPRPPVFFNGVIAGEQEQACLWNPQGAPEHDPQMGCRLTFYDYENGSLAPVELSRQGTQNQTVVEYNNGIAVVGANHGVFGGYAALQIWLLTPPSQTFKSMVDSPH